MATKKDYTADIADIGDLDDDQDLDRFPPPPNARRVDLENYLFFSISGMRFCVPLTQIMSIVRIDDTMMDIDYGFELPDLCKGFVRYRRQQVPLLDLRGKLGLPHTGVPAGAVGLMIDFGVTYFSLMVDLVYSLEAGNRGHVLPLPTGISELGDGFTGGYVEYPQGGAFLLDTMTMFSEADIEQLASII